MLPVQSVDAGGTASLIIRNSLTIYVKSLREMTFFRTVSSDVGKLARRSFGSSL